MLGYEVHIAGPCPKLSGWSQSLQRDAVEALAVFVADPLDVAADERPGRAGELHIDGNACECGGMQAAAEPWMASDRSR